MYENNSILWPDNFALKSSNCSSERRRFHIKHGSTIRKDFIAITIIIIIIIIIAVITIIIINITIIKLLLSCPN